MTSGSCSKSAGTSSSRASVVWFPILFDITSLRGTVHSWCAQLREREPVRAWRGCGCKDWDVLIVGAGESLLGLHHLDGVCHAGSEAVFRPGEALIGKCDTLLGHFHLLFRGIQVEKCSAYVVVNLAANVLCFGFALSELSFGLGYVAFDPATGENGNVHAGLKSKITMRVPEGRPDVAVISVGSDYWKAFAFGGRKALRGCFLGIECGAEVIARPVR